MGIKYARETDDDGNVGIKDPPILRDYERRLEDAKSDCDKDMIGLVTKEYEDERRRVAEALDRQDTDEETYDPEPHPDTDPENPTSEPPMFGAQGENQ